jgi:hypothetical protein
VRLPLLVLCVSGCGYSSYYPDLPDHLIETGSEPVAPITAEIPCSAPQGQPVELTLYSQADFPLHLSTVTADTCAEMPFLVLGARETTVVQTTDNWVWTARDGDGALYAVFQVPSGASYWAQLVP